VPLSGEPAKPLVEFHQHKIPHPAKESGLFNRFHHNQRALLNGLSVKLKINGADNLPLFKRRGKLRFA
jgi:hypothetical protein